MTNFWRHFTFSRNCRDCCKTYKNVISEKKKKSSTSLESRTYSPADFPIQSSMSKSSILKPYLSKLYYLYTYNTPFGVLSCNEAIVFNLIVLTSIGFSIYWAVTVLPVLITRLLEATYYYLTGNTVPVGLIALLYFSTKLFWHVPAIPQTGTNITRIGRERFSL